MGREQGRPAHDLRRRELRWNMAAGA
eukprot:SAG31_NODE_10779_length_1099_cov_1.026000_2_plen_25_part_01